MELEQSIVDTSFFSQLSNDLIFYVLTYQDYDTLRDCFLVSRLWREILLSSYADTKLWSRLYRDYTSNFRANVTTLSILDRVKAVAAGNLRRYLSMKNVDTSRCVEIGDFRAMLIAVLVFGRRPNIASRSLLYYPEWTLSLLEWRASFYHARKDSQRSSILKSELCAFRWGFKFKAHVYLQEMPDDYTLESKFNDDYSYNSPMFDQNLLWRVVEESGEGIKRVQVDHYPILTISRLSDGCWLLENDNVTLTQVIEPNRETAPLL